MFSLIVIVMLGYFFTAYDLDVKRIVETHKDGYEKGKSDWVENCGAIELVKFLKRHDSVSAGCVNYIVQTKDGYNCQSEMICFDPEKEKFYLGFFETEILIDNE